MIYDLIVIGGGAAGFYGAIQAASRNSSLRILILEKTTKVLAKVKVSGGGRCNVTHECFNPFELARHYPRGERSLKSLFKTHNAAHVVDWFASKGVQLKVEEDGRMFPTSNNSMTIINCFTAEAARLDIKVALSESVNKLQWSGETFKLDTLQQSRYECRKVLIATGGHSGVEHYQWIRSMGHSVVTPIPSLFTFNDSEKRFIDLMGIAVSEAEIRIQSTKFLERGPLLITHWGLSGPAVIKLSAWAAAYLYETNYKFDVLVNWAGVKEDICRTQLMANKIEKAKQKIYSNAAFGLPYRLWQRLCELSEIQPERTWGDAAHKEINRLVQNLVYTVFHIVGKTTFKEEFVTCGGVDLREINIASMESKLVENLYFAGEVLNIDGETGGFNFQGAWTTAYIAAQAIAEEINQPTG
jgi:predicted Rossmann fold flavoprotein